MANLAENPSNTAASGNGAPATPVGQETPGPGTEAIPAGRPLVARRAVILGLGSTGYNSLIMLRRLLLERYGTLQSLPIRFLCLETNGAARYGQIADYDHPELRLQDDEWYHLSVEGAGGIHLTDYPGLRGWVPPSAVEADIRDGAGNSRVRGRLAFFWNYEKVARRLQSHWREVITQRSPNGEDRRQADGVYVVGTLAGGTCSGTFIDVGYTLREILDPTPEIIGYFSVVGAGASQVLQANCYAALKELNHFNGGAGVYEALHTDGTKIALSPSDYPYDLPYLLTSETGQAGHALTEEQISELVALDMFNDISSPSFWEARRAARDNIKVQCLNQMDNLGCPKRYITVGLAMVQYPAYKYRHACAARLGRDLISEWLQTSANVSAQDLVTTAERDLQNAKLLPAAGDAHVVGSALQLHLMDTDERLTKRANGWQSEVRAKLGEWCKGGGYLKLASFMRYNHEHDLHKDYFDMGGPRVLSEDDACSLLDRSAPGNWSTAKRHIHEVAQEQLQVLTAGLDRAVSDNIENSAYRVDNTTKILTNMAEQLEREAAKSKESADYYFQMARQLDTQYQRALEAVDATAGSFSVRLSTGFNPAPSVRKAGEKSLQLCSAWHEMQTRAVVEETMYCLYLSLRQRVIALRKQVEELRGLLTDVNDELGRVERQYTTQPALMLGETVDPHVAQGDPVGDCSAAGNTDATRAAVQTKVMGELTGIANPAIYDLKRRGISKGQLINSLVMHALPCFDYVSDTDVLRLWVDRHPNPTEKQDAIRRVWNDAQVHLGLVTQDPDNPLSGREDQTIFAFGSRDRDAAAHMRELLNGLAAENPNISETGQDPFRLIMLREYGGFPLRIWTGLRRLREAFDLRSNSQSHYSREDIHEWSPLEDVPSSAVQLDTWRNLVAGWVLGMVKSERQGDALRFSFCYSGMDGERTCTSAPWGPAPPTNPDGSRADQKRLRTAPPDEMRPVVNSIHQQGTAPRLQEVAATAVDRLRAQYGDYAPVYFQASCSDFLNDEHHSRLGFAPFLKEALEGFKSQAKFPVPGNGKASEITWPESPVKMALNGSPQRLVINGNDEYGHQTAALLIRPEFQQGNDVVAIDASGMVTPLKAGRAVVRIVVPETPRGSKETQVEIEVA